MVLFWVSCDVVFQDTTIKKNRGLVFFCLLVDHEKTDEREKIEQKH